MHLGFSVLQKSPLQHWNIAISNGLLFCFLFFSLFFFSFMEIVSCYFIGKMVNFYQCSLIWWLSAGRIATLFNKSFHLLGTGGNPAMYPINELSHRYWISLLAQWLEIQRKALFKAKMEQQWGLGGEEELKVNLVKD